MTIYLRNTVFPYLVNKIEIYCTPFYDREQIHGALKHYQKTFKREGILDLAAFIMYAEKTNFDFNRIREALLLDLEQRGNALAIPKTRGYFQTIQKLK